MFPFDRWGGGNEGSIWCSIFVNDVPLFSGDPRGTEGMLPDLGGEERRKESSEGLAVGGLPLHWVSADPLSSSYGLDHHC